MMKAKTSEIDDKSLVFDRELIGFSIVDSLLCVGIEYDGN